MTITTTHSPTPWTYEYNPYTVQRGDAAAEELPAFEIFDAEQNKIFDTNEDMPCEIQEANARLASAAPAMLAELVGISEIWSNAEGGSEVMDYLENRLYAIRAAIAEATADGDIASQPRRLPAIAMLRPCWRRCGWPRAR